MFDASANAIFDAADEAYTSFVSAARAATADGVGEVLSNEDDDPEQPPVTALDVVDGVDLLSEGHRHGDLGHRLPV